MKKELRFFYMIRSLFILFFCISLSYSQEEKKSPEFLPKIFIKDIVSSTSDVNMNLQLQNMPNDVNNISFSINNEKINASVKKNPVNLWILLDSSAICKALEFDKFGKNIVKTLKTSLHKDSVVSIVSYHKGKHFHFHDHRPIEVISDVLNFECGSAPSENYEEALKSLLKEETKSNLPTYLWVFSSGNALLSKETSEILKKRRIHTNLYFFLNSFNAQLMIKSNSDFLGADLFSFHQGSVEQLMTISPTTFYSVDFDVPRSKRGIHLDLKVEALGKEGAIATTATKVIVEKGKYFTLVQYAIYFLYLSILILFGFFIYKLVLFYKPIQCPHCHEFMRRTDQYCLSCEKGILGYLVIQNNFQEKSFPQIYPFGERHDVKIGTSKASDIFLQAGKNHQSLNYFTLKIEDIGTSCKAISITPNPYLENLNIKINDSYLRSKRYLFSGNHLEVPGYSIDVFIGGDEHVA